MGRDQYTRRSVPQPNLQTAAIRLVTKRQLLETSSFLPCVLILQRDRTAQSVPHPACPATRHAVSNLEGHFHLSARDSNRHRTRRYPLVRSALPNGDTRERGRDAPSSLTPQANRSRSTISSAHFQN